MYIDGWLGVENEKGVRAQLRKKTRKMESELDGSS